MSLKVTGFLMLNYMNKTAACCGGKKKLISVFAEAESNCNRELVFLFSKNFQEFNVIVKNVVNICTDLLSVLTWFGEGILVLKKKS